MNGNREYKSDVFAMLLEDKDNALSLYNAINHSHYEDASELIMNRLDNSISMSVRNDASFIFDAYINIYEHQSTYCPNMPLRNLFYICKIWDEDLKEKDIYGKKLQKVPTPCFVVFYNGVQKQPEKSVMRLSEAFLQPTDTPNLELICQVYNINVGNNKELLEGCRFLKEYAEFVDCARKRVLKYGTEYLDEALEEAVEYCIENDILKKFLRKRKQEVLKNMVLDYTYERRLELARIEKEEEIEEAKKEARKEGWEENNISLVLKKLRKNKSIEQIADELEEEQSTILPIIEFAKPYAPEYEEKTVIAAYMEAKKK